MVKASLTEWTGKGATRLVLIAAMLFWFLYDSYQPVRAETKSIVVDLSMHGLVESRDFFRQAEARGRDEIKRQFSQNPNLSEVQVVVLGDRHGEIVPILTTTVSRTQWQETPRLSAWTKYYNPSYVLLQRHEGEPRETVVRNPVRASISTQSLSSEIDRAFDEGRLTGVAAQKYLNQLD